LKACACGDEAGNPWPYDGCIFVFDSDGKSANLRCNGSGDSEVVVVEYRYGGKIAVTVETGRGHATFPENVERWRRVEKEKLILILTI
jgi:hypothetical protein